LVGAEEKDEEEEEEEGEEEEEEEEGEEEEEKEEEEGVKPRCMLPLLFWVLKTVLNMQLGLL
jgi:hypothetical protein